MKKIRSIRRYLGSLSVAAFTLPLLLAQEEPSTPDAAAVPDQEQAQSPETDPQPEPPSQPTPETEPIGEAISPPAQLPDLIIADFEGAEYGDWTAEGEAFGNGPASGALDDQMAVAGFAGQGLANSFHQGDHSTGRLTSPEFTIERPYINLLIGGGTDVDKLRVELLIDGAVARRLSGPNSETLRDATWEVSEFAGKAASLVAVDEHTEGWGHLLLDQIVQSSERKGTVTVARERSFGVLTSADTFLNLPVKTGAPKTRMTMAVDGDIVRAFDIELSDEPDLWVFDDLRNFAGKTLSVSVDGINSESQAMDLIETSETIRNEDELYHESLRPQFHFSTKRGWINDPNGLVYEKGQYHLFYQHNPYGWNWGNMHWGHAVSPDLVHWEQLPIALYPKAYGDWAFSGSALVDEANTSGFKNGSRDVLVAFFTSTGRGECVAYSNDSGLTWTEYEGNPVIEHQGRDPKVIWHEPTRQWVLAVYDEDENERWIAFHTSPNLREWTFQSRIAGFYECPEIFEIPLDLDPTQSKWVIYGADGDYMVGSFDGKTFTPDEPNKIKGNQGNCFYASQMYSNLPEYDRRYVQIGWGRVAMPGMPFNQQMLFPCTLRLRRTSEGPRLHTTPVREIARLYQSSDFLENEVISSSRTLSTAELLDMEAHIDVSEAQRLVFDVRGTAVTIDVSQGTVTCLDKTAPIEITEGEISIRLLVDRTTIEIFVNEGRVYMPMGVLLDTTKAEVNLEVEGQATLKRLRVSPLNSIWK